MFYFLYKDGMSQFFNVAKTTYNYPRSITFWVKCNKAKTKMFKVLHHPHLANIYWFYCWLWTWKYFLGRIVIFIFKSFHTKINCNLLKISNVEMWDSSRVWDRGLNSGKALYLWIYYKGEGFYFVLVPRWHDITRFLKRIFLRKSLLFFMISDCKYQFQHLIDLC